MCVCVRGRLSKVNPKYAIGWTVLDRNTSVRNMAHYLVNMLHKNLIGNNTTCHFLLDWDWARCTLSSHKICGEVRRVQFLKVEQAYFIFKQCMFHFEYLMKRALNSGQCGHFRFASLHCKSELYKVQKVQIKISSPQWSERKGQDQVHRHIWAWSFLPDHNDLMWT